MTHSLHDITCVLYADLQGLEDIKRKVVVSRLDACVDEGSVGVNVRANAPAPHVCH